MPQRRKYDPKKVLAAVALHPTNLRAAAEEVPCSKGTVLSYLKWMDAEAGRPVIERNYGEGRAKRIDWNADNIAKLANIFHRPVCPNDAAIAAEMGITLSALWTAKIRFGLGKRTQVYADAKRTYVQVNPKQIIACLNCGKPFGSHGKGNRLCISCGGIGSISYEEA